MSSVAHPPMPREIKPRPLTRSYERAPRDWIAGDAFTSSLMNSLSLTFPEGERFFMAAVRAHRDQLTDPALRSQVKGFLAQEALHAREHDRFNRHLSSQGIDTERFYGEVAALLGRTERQLPAIGRLAVTCALEHFTAMLAELLLAHGSLLEGADPELRALWQWHAIEELEHKAVAFDVYRAAGGTHRMRVILMAVTTALFIAKVTHIHARILAQTGQLRRPDRIARGLWRFWGPRGLFTALIPAYLRYFRRDFHPNETSQDALIQAYEQQLALQGQ